ncbi:MAG TPA: hypothetical protein DE045_02105 [Oceanospirillaceae bacterium]|nr:hypothetical protein [Oceanospirillaceae bacterium]
MTAKGGAPSRDWMNPNLGYVHASRTRSKISHYFKQQDKDKNCTAGRLLVEREMRRMAITGVDYAKLSTSINFKSADDMYAALGAGDLRLAQIVNAAQQQVEPSFKPKKQLDLTLLTGKSKPASSNSGDIQIAGVGNLLTTLASCCKPVPGDAIMGFVTLNRGVSVHRQDCLNIMNMAEQDRQRIIDVDWSSQSEQTYPVDIFIEAIDRPGLLSEVVMVLGNEHVNLGNVNTQVDKTSHSATIAMTIDIPRLDLLGRILDKISQLPNVLDVRRRKNG